MEELIRKMQRDMVIQDYSPRTVECYLWHAKAFIDFFSKPVDSLNEEDIRDYLYHVKTDKQYSHSHLAQAFSAIKYLFRETLDMPLSYLLSKAPNEDENYLLFYPRTSSNRSFPA